MHRLNPEGTSKSSRVWTCVNFEQSCAFIDLKEAEDFISVSRNDADKEVEQKLISASGGMQYLPSTLPAQKGVEAFGVTC